MTDHKTLGVDLYNLQLAADNFKDIASTHTKAAGTVSGIDATAAFHRPDGVGDPTTLGCWQSLQQSISSMLSTNGTNLSDSARALEYCVQHYAASDERARHKFVALGGRVEKR